MRLRIARFINMHEYDIVNLNNRLFGKNIAHFAGKTDGCSVIEQRLETALFIFIFCQIVVCYEAIGKRAVLLFFACLVGRA